MRQLGLGAADALQQIECARVHVGAFFESRQYAEDEADQTRSQALPERQEMCFVDA